MIRKPGAWHSTRGRASISTRAGRCCAKVLAFAAGITSSLRGGRRRPGTRPGRRASISPTAPARPSGAPEAGGLALDQGEGPRARPGRRQGRPVIRKPATWKVIWAPETWKVIQAPETWHSTRGRAWISTRAGRCCAKVSPFAAGIPSRLRGGRRRPGTRPGGRASISPTAPARPSGAPEAGGLALDQGEGPRARPGRRQGRPVIRKPATWKVIWAPETWKVIQAPETWHSTRGRAWISTRAGRCCAKVSPFAAGIPSRLRGGRRALPG